MASSVSVGGLEGKATVIAGDYVAAVLRDPRDVSQAILFQAVCMMMARLPMLEPEAKAAALALAEPHLGWARKYDRERDPERCRSETRAIVRALLDRRTAADIVRTATAYQRQRDANLDIRHVHGRLARMRLRESVIGQDDYRPAWILEAIGGERWIEW